MTETEEVRIPVHLRKPVFVTPVRYKHRPGEHYVRGPKRRDFVVDKRGGRPSFRGGTGTPGKPFGSLKASIILRK